MIKIYQEDILKTDKIKETEYQGKIYHDTLFKVRPHTTTFRQLAEYFDK